jgi:methylisocitrate lyase
MSASMGLPDLGVITVDEVCFFVRQVARASGLPLMVDGDTGYGEALNVMHMVRAFEEAGAGAVHIEDQLLPKKCGHLNDKKLVPVEEMCRKVAAARKASSELLICARTDAAGGSLNDAIMRARHYRNAGADVIFVEALTSPDDIARVRAEVAAPLLANMTEFGRTPQLSLKEWDAAGFELVIFPVSSFRVAAGRVQRFYESLHRNGDVKEMLPEMMTRAELYDTISYYDYEALDASIARTVLPER